MKITFKVKKKNIARCGGVVSPAFGKWGRRDGESEASLSYTARLYLKEWAGDMTQVAWYAGSHGSIHSTIKKINKADKMLYYNTVL